MQKTEEEVLALFRSLRPDDKHLQTSQPTAAHEAQQRWAMLKAIPTKSPEATPPLSNEERLAWSSAKKNLDNERKAPVSAPSLGDKLSKGLLKMSGRGVAPSQSVASPKVAAVTVPIAPTQVGMPVVAMPEAPLAELPPQNEPVPAASHLSMPLAAKLKVGLRASKLGLFAKEPPAPPVAPPANLMATVAAEVKVTPTPIPLDNSLAAVFGRLAHQVEAQAAEPAKKHSFLSQLGKK